MSRIAFIQRLCEALANRHCKNCLAPSTSKAAQLYFFTFVVSIMECPDTEIGLSAAVLTAMY